MEFVVIRDDADHFRAILHDLEFFIVRDGMLEHLPPSADLPGDVWQIWGGDMQRGRWRVDMMIEPGTPDRWIYKRDRTVQMARTDAVRISEAGIPYLAPINVMLFKAKYLRDKDQQDFRIAQQKISILEKKQLIAWLDELHPGHEWIETLRIGGERDATSTESR